MASVFMPTLFCSSSGSIPGPAAAMPHALCGRQQCVGNCRVGHFTYIHIVAHSNRHSPILVSTTAVLAHLLVASRLCIMLSSVSGEMSPVLITTTFVLQTFLTIARLSYFLQTVLQDSISSNNVACSSMCFL